MNDLTKSQRFHAASFTTMTDDKDYSRLMLQARFMVGVDYRKFLQFVAMEENASTTKRYYKLRSLSRGKVRPWFMGRGSDLEEDISRSAMFHDTIMTDLTDGKYFSDAGRGWYTSVDHDVKCEEGSQSDYRNSMDTGTRGLFREERRCQKYSEGVLFFKKGSTDKQKSKSAVYFEAVYEGGS